MKNMLKEVLAFCVGVAVGGGSTYIFLKKRFAKRLDNEVESIKKLYLSKYCDNDVIATESAFDHLSAELAQAKKEDKKDADIQKETKELTHVAEKPALKDLVKMSKSKTPDEEDKTYINYASYYSNADSGEDTSTNAKPKEETPGAVKSIKKAAKKPNVKVISPDEFETEEDYAVISLTYYSDGILADEADNPVKIETTIGKDALNHFGDYDEEDIVYLRSDSIKTYYEVVRDNRSFEEVSGTPTDNGDKED